MDESKTNNNDNNNVVPPGTVGCSTIGDDGHNDETDYNVGVVMAGRVSDFSIDDDDNDDDDVALVSSPREKYNSDHHDGDGDDGNIKKKEEESLVEEAMKREASLHDSIARIAHSILDSDNDEDDADEDGQIPTRDVGFISEPEKTTQLDDSAIEEATVPFSQFQNALMIIQELEDRLQTIEGRNRVLEAESIDQKRMIDAYEMKLQQFPKLVEDAVQQGDRQAAAAAAAASKDSFWKEYMDRQEEQERKKQEAEKAKPYGARSFSTLRQSDFLRDLVVTKQAEQKSAASRFWMSGKGRARKDSGGATNLKNDLALDDDLQLASSTSIDDDRTLLKSRRNQQVLNLLS